MRRSSITDAGGKRSGIGVILIDPHHEVIIALGEPAGALSPLAAEMAALVAAVTTAVARGTRDLRVHTDCRALVHLWQDRRGNDSLSGLREALRPLRRFQLRLIPRRLNQSANALARDVLPRLLKVTPTSKARVCSAFAIDPLTAIASGSLLLTAPAQDAAHISAALEQKGVPCKEIGEVTDEPPQVMRLTRSGWEPYPFFRAETGPRSAPHAGSKACP